MGDIADAILHGTLCWQCGDFIGFDNGFATLCSSCKAEERRQPTVGRGSRYNVKAAPKIAKPSDPVRKGDTMSCPFCVKRVKMVGFGQHMLDQRLDKWPETLL